jgi:hypothetical protein
MFPHTPSLTASTFALIVGVLMTFGFAVIWTIFALTLVVSMLVAVHRSIPRDER